MPWPINLFHVFIKIHFVELLRLYIQGLKNSVYKLWGFLEEIKRNPFVMWQISDMFFVSSLGVLEGFDAGWFYRSCLKCSPFAANDCLSRIIAAASSTRAASSSGVSIGVSYTKHFISSQIKKSIGERSGEGGGHCTGPSLPIQRLGKTLFRYYLTSREKCAGAPSCWNHNHCLNCSGTFSNISGNMSRIKIM